MNKFLIQVFLILLPAMLIAQTTSFNEKERILVNGNPISENYGYYRARMNATAGDWNGDGLLDIISCEGYRDYTFKVWLNKGTKEEFLYTDSIVFGPDTVHLKDGKFA